MTEIRNSVKHSSLFGSTINWDDKKFYWNMHPDMVLAKFKSEKLAIVGGVLIDKSVTKKHMIGASI